MYLKRGMWLRAGGRGATDAVPVCKCKHVITKQTIPTPYFPYTLVCKLARCCAQDGAEPPMRRSTYMWKP